MTTLHGEILPYLEAIGAEDGSEPMLAAMNLVGTRFTIDEYTSAGMHEKYLMFTKGGVDFLVIDGIVDTIFFRLAESDEGAAYARPNSLVEGIEHHMPVEDLKAVLGSPIFEATDHIVYRVGEKFLNIDIEDGRVDKLCVQLFDFGAESDGGRTDSAAPAKPITGEISLLIDAAGTAYGDKVMIDLVDALGPRLDSHDTDEGTGTFLVFDSGGVDVQYRDGVLAGVLIHIAHDERRPYPRLDALVDGLSLPATRTDVTQTLGTPQESLPDVDLYSERGRFVMFNYTGDDLTTISIAYVPAGG